MIIPKQNFSQSSIQAINCRCYMFFSIFSYKSPFSSQHTHSKIIRTKTANKFRYKPMQLSYHCLEIGFFFIQKRVRVNFVVSKQNVHFSNWFFFLKISKRGLRTKKNQKQRITNNEVRSQVSLFV